MERFIQLSHFHNVFFMDISDIHTNRKRILCFEYIYHHDVNPLFGNACLAGSLVKSHMHLLSSVSQRALTGRTVTVATVKKSLKLTIGPDTTHNLIICETHSTVPFRKLFCSEITITYIYYTRHNGNSWFCWHSIYSVWIQTVWLILVFWLISITLSYL